MRIFKILRISFLTLLSFFKTPLSPPFNSISIAPLGRGEETLIKVDTDSNYLRFSVFISNDRYSSQEILSDTITKPGVYKYTYNNSYTRTKSKIFIKYATSESGTYTTSEKYDFNVSNVSKTKYISDDDVITTTKTIGVFKSDLSFERKELTFTFDGFKGIYAPDYYHKIDLKEFKIYLDETYHDFMIGNPSIVLGNVDGVFNDIDGVDSQVIFPLTLEDKGDYYTFSLTHTLYVNPHTLRLSSNPKVGYVQTEHIFLPVNEMKKQTEFAAMFALSSMGIDKDYWIHRFEIRATSNLLGDCHNSQYCVVREYE